MNEYKVREDEHKTRLDKFLTEKSNIDNIGLSRNKIQKLIDEGLVKVNGEESKINYRLKNGDVVEINENDIEKKTIAPDIKKIDLDIADITVEESKDFIVVDKPAGVIVHDFENAREETLVDCLLKKYPEIRQIGEDPARPGIVHRIDREVSGLMVIARNQKSFDSLKEQFKKRTVQKYYKALVYGSPAKDNDEILFPIGRSKSRYKMAALPKLDKGEEQKEGKRAISEFEVLERKINYTLLLVKIKTGRTHQIRVHLSAYGNPIVGDNVYTTNKLREKNNKNNLGRIFLQAYFLSFLDLDGEKREFQIELPNELQNFLSRAK